MIDFEATYQIDHNIVFKVMPSVDLWHLAGHDFTNKIHK
jgi:hypothetical protein